MLVFPVIVIIIQNIYLQSLRKRRDSAKQDSGDSEEFDTDAPVFKDRDIESETKSVLQDIAKLSKKFESVALRDAYGRELRRRDSIDSCFVQEDSGSSVSLGNSLNSSPLSTMSKIQFSSASSASTSSRKSSDEMLPYQSRHSRSLSSSKSDSVSPRKGRRLRQMSAGSVLSTGSRSPGMPRKVGEPFSNNVVHIANVKVNIIGFIVVL